MLKNVASQKWRVYAWTTSTGAAKTGDAANISAYLTVDAGTPAATNDAAPTEVSSTNEPGYYEFDLTQAETNGTRLTLSPKSSTSGVAVIACPPVIYTRPQYFDVLSVNSSGKTSPADGSITSDTIATDAIDADSIKADAVTKIQNGLATPTNITAGTITTVTNLTNAPTNGDLTATMKTSVTAAVPTANANADALLDRADGVETGLTFRQWLRLGAAALFGKASGLGTTTAVYRDIGDTKDRISATVDADGNRTAVTRDAT